MHDLPRRRPLSLACGVLAAAALLAACAVEPTTPDAGRGAADAAPAAHAATGRTPQPVSLDPKPKDAADLEVEFATLGARHTAVLGVEPAGAAPTAESTDPSDAGLTPYAADTIRLGAHWQLTGGARWDRMPEANSFGETWLGADSMPRSRAALVYRSPGIGSYYVGAGDSLDPSPKQLRLSVPNADARWGLLYVKPSDGMIHEAGARLDLLGGRLSLRGTVFRTETIYAWEDESGSFEEARRTDGLEVNAIGRLAPGWHLVAGYGLVESETLAAYDPAEVGKELPDMPAQSAELWTSYQLPAGFLVGGGVRFVDKRMTDALNLASMPGFVAFDASVVYRLVDRVDLRLDLQNLSDERGYDTAYAGSEDLGLGRAARISTGFRF